jgi:hypothetical protein
MTQLVKIENQTITVKEYKGQKVVTFKDIDTVHGRPAGTARKRFNDNKERFVAGKDYFVRNSDEARKEFNIAAPNGLILLTESGYLMLVKSLTDDLAWKVQRQLVENYFHAAKPVQQQLKLEEPYHYEYKTWQGEQVVTLRDIAALTGACGGTVRNAMFAHRRDFKPSEAQLLSDESLRAFRKENPAVNMERTVSLWVLTAKGTKKLLGLLTVEHKALTVWQKKEPTKSDEDITAEDIDLLFNSFTCPATDLKKQRPIRAASNLVKSMGAILEAMQSPCSLVEMHTYIETVKKMERLLERRTKEFGLADIQYTRQ